MGGTNVEVIGVSHMRLYDGVCCTDERHGPNLIALPPIIILPLQVRQLLSRDRWKCFGVHLNTIHVRNTYGCHLARPFFLNFMPSLEGHDFWRLQSRIDVLELVEKYIKGMRYAPLALFFIRGGFGGPLWVLSCLSRLFKGIFRFVWRGG